MEENRRKKTLIKYRLQCIHCQRWMNDNYVKFEFEIQLLHTYHESNGDSVYTISVGKINP